MNQQAADRQMLVTLNETFIAAVRAGDRTALEAILTDDFTFMAGQNGEIWNRETFFANTIRPGFYLSLTHDQNYIQQSGDSALISARTVSIRIIDGQKVETTSRFIDCYSRLNGVWRCHFACLWKV